MSFSWNPLREEDPVTISVVEQLNQAVTSLSSSLDISVPTLPSYSQFSKVVASDTTILSSAIDILSDNNWCRSQHTAKYTHNGTQNAAVCPTHRASVNTNNSDDGGNYSDNSRNSNDDSSDYPTNNAANYTRNGDRCTSAG